MAIAKDRNGRCAGKVDLVLEGGGVKGIGLVGALVALEECGYDQPQNIAGTSIGAIIGALLAAGYTARELRQIMLEKFDFPSVRDPSLEGRLPLVGKPLSFLCNLGICDGDALEEQVEKLLKAKGVRTFGDIPYEGPDRDQKKEYHYKLQVIASDLTERDMLVLPRDAEKLGLKPDRMSVAQAVRMSASIPIFFKPVVVTGPESKRHIIVDGALSSNFPVWLFDSGGDPEWPTFGLHLMNPYEFTGFTDRIPSIERTYGNPVAQVISYALSLVVTTLQAHDQQYITQESFPRTILIPTLGVGLIDFDISRARKSDLYYAGYKAGQEFLATWNFDRYRAEFRSGKQNSRRECVIDQMMRQTA